MPDVAEPITDDPRAVKAEQIRDLRRHIEGLSREDEAEFLFRDTSPVRRKATVYSMLNGEPVEIPYYMLENVLLKTLDDGRDAFTAIKDQAPEFKLGSVKCFLHRDSPERAFLDEIGLGQASCPAAHLANLHSKRMHGLHRHKQEWAALEEYLGAKKEEEYIERQERQLEATLALAGKAASAPAETAVECSEEGCGYTGTKNQLRGHKMAKHK